MADAEQLRQHCCICHEFHRAATRNPNKIAVIHASSSPPQSQLSTTNSVDPPVYPGDHCFTFADILSSVASLSSRLRSILNGADDLYFIRKLSSPSTGRRTEPESSGYLPKVIGIYMPPSVEYIISLLSILSCGEAFLPLDPSWPRDRILSIISSSNAAFVIACGTSFGVKSCQPIHESHWIFDSCSCPVLSFSMEESIQGPLSSFVPCEDGARRLFCYLMYTSGSTGKPKGVCGTEQGLLNRFLWMQELYPLHGEEVILFKTSISFIDHLQEFLAAILTACTLVIPPFTKINSNIFSVIDYLKAYSISRFTAVPSLMRAILPAMQSHHDIWISSSLKLLVISGEVLPLSLWKILSSLLPNTSILNLYGSTEVSGDCTYFDCKMLPAILEKETLSSVPIGLPISNCDVVLGDAIDNSNEGEIYIGGMCVSIGYFSENTITSLCSTKLHHNSLCSCSDEHCRSQLYFRTGDFARRLPSGDLVFLGRKDRTVKIYGQRIALEEIEDTLRGHCDVADAAVICLTDKQGVKLLVACVSCKDKEKSNETLRASIRIWMTSNLPSAMIPNKIIFVESLPKFASGKLDYRSLEGLILTAQGEDDISGIGMDDLMQTIKKVFCMHLMVGNVSDDDDFFVMGGNSIAAAHVSHTLGIDMRLLYANPTPSRLIVALTDKKGVNNDADVRSNGNLKLNTVPNKGNAFNAGGSTSPRILGSGLSRTSYSKDVAHNGSYKRLKVESNKHLACGCDCSSDGGPWKPAAMPVSCSFSRSNMIMPEGRCGVGDIHQIAQIMNSPRSRKGSMEELWKVNMESCVDASPVVVFKGSEVYLFIGSHSHDFLCVNAKCGSVHWKIRLEGRIEGSAVVASDFSQVVVGCYSGKIYFLDFLNGKICWTFQTSGEVKCQPLMDANRQLIWCGSHDHNLYALDYKNHYCVYKLPCGGSIFGSPAIDEVHDMLYVASTSGRITAISIKDSPFHIQWLHELEVPIFGSLCITSPNRYVICCLVDGHVLAFDSSGSIIWKYRTSGPIFAGACISSVLPSQVLINSRSGSVYSFDQEKGDLVWEIDVGDPITSSAYVDENLELFSSSSVSADRLVCICTSSGVVILLSVNMDEPKTSEARKEMVQEFARVELEGDVFSSPVMIGGRIFVGCRDDYLHCIVAETLDEK